MKGTCGEHEGRVCMDRTTRGALITAYTNGYRAVVDALEGMTEAQLDARPGPGEWTPREIVYHLADSEMTSALRLRRLLAEENPEIAGYDEEAFARRLHYGDRPIGPSLDALRAARATTASILDCMTEDEWAREGTHSESGRYTAEGWLEIYVAHARDHAAQIRRARKGASDA